MRERGYARNDSQEGEEEIAVAELLSAMTLSIE
jgi:hypothetical protein